MIDRPLRILWVNGWTRVGGAERAQLTVFRELCAQNWHISAVFPVEAERTLIDAAYAAGIKTIHHAPLTQLSQTLDPYVLSGYMTRWVRSVSALGRAIAETKPDLIHLACLYDIPFCAAAARIYKVPMFWWIENPERFNTLNRSILNICGLKGLAGTSTAILQAAEDAGVRANTKMFVPNAYDDRVFDSFDSSSATTSTQLSSVVKIGFSGIFQSRKGLLELCTAFGELSKSVPNVELLLAGDGDAVYVNEMKQILSESGTISKVQFLGYLKTQAQVREFYRNIDIFVMLSKREGLSVAMLEAMACGTPAAILSPWGDDVIEHGVNGIRLSDDLPETFVKEIQPLVLNPALRHQLGRAAAKTVTSMFSPKVVAQKLENFYRSGIQ